MNLVEFADTYAPYAQRGVIFDMTNPFLAVMSEVPGFHPESLRCLLMTYYWQAVLANPHFRYLCLRNSVDPGAPDFTAIVVPRSSYALYDLVLMTRRGPARPETATVQLTAQEVRDGWIASLAARGHRSLFEERLGAEA